MDELGFDFTKAVPWFPHSQDQPYVFITLSEAQANQLANEMAIALRRCYATDAHLIERSVATGNSQAEVLASRLPDPGSTMAGDFGEIFCYFYQSAKELPSFAIGAKKWRLKQDRSKPAPRSDVVHFVMPDRPHASGVDAVLCSEVKVKSTAGTSSPITSAIDDSKKDRVSRLAETLVWLRERALSESLGDIDIPMLERFINLVDYPPAAKRYRAVAVICESLVEKELPAAPTTPEPDCTVVVITVPNLKKIYEAVFTAARATVPIPSP